MARPALTLFSPLPPARNGIADYAGLLAEGLAAHYTVQPGREDTPPAARLLHQLGNNPDHAFVLRALARWPGVVTLHDPSLLWLRQQMGEAPRAEGEGRFARLAAQRVAQLAAGAGVGRADHLLLDQAGPVLAQARAVVVHSRFAAARLRALHGAAAAAKVVVVPHLLPPVRGLSRAEARQRLGLPEHGFILGTAGFAHPGKRFDWLLAALAQTGGALHYLHAGAHDPALPLAGMLAGQPALAGRWRVTGWLAAEALDTHIAACDALACLHFPSHGETSGILARGLAMGVACLVADTAAYAELPRDAVQHVPVPHAVPALTATLRRWAAAPSEAHALGATGQAWARQEMALDKVAARYAEVIEATLPTGLASLAAPRPTRRPAPRVLMVAPMPSHPPEQGNSARLAAFGAALQRRGAQVELLYYGLDGISPEGEAAMRTAWAAYHYAPPQPHARQSLPTTWGLDDWCPDALCAQVAALHKARGYQAVVANYVWQSRVLEHAPGALRVLDTHDLFGNRQQVALAEGLEPNWYFTSLAEEARGLARAQLVLAIQPAEATELRQRTTQRVLVVGHRLALRPRPAGAALAPFGLLASGNPWNLAAVHALDAALAGSGLSWLLAGGVAAHPALRLRSEALRLGRVARVEAFYAQVDCVLNPMLGGTGLKIKTVEALAHGLPVLGTAAAFAGLATRHPGHQAPDAAALLPLMREWLANPAFQAGLAAASATLAQDYAAATEAQYDALMARLGS